MTSGQQPLDLVQSSSNKYLLEWHQTPETTANYREANVWERYKRYTHIAIAISVLQSALVVLLIIHMRRSRASDDTVRRLTRRLIKAGEEERSHLARELHDDLGQRLSLVAVQLSQIHSIEKNNGTVANGSIDEPLNELITIITDVHNLSHSLHSTKLEHLGLEAALKELCRKHTAIYDIPITLTAAKVPLDIVPDIALSLYRVTQEALYNAVKHSAATQVDVTLQNDSSHVAVTVHDNGVGFNPSSHANGLGLATMEERMSLVNGRLSVTSKSAEGTTVTARAPFKKRSKELHSLHLQ